MTSWDNKLKPCPFCGGKAEIKDTVMGYVRDSVIWPECQKCGCRLPKIYVKASYCANDKAVEAWNRRANNETV